MVAPTVLRGFLPHLKIKKKPVRTAAGSSGFHLRKMLYLKLSTALYSNSYYIYFFKFFEGVGNFLERKFLTKTIHKLTSTLR